MQSANNAALFCLGKTPQIITEGLWGLLHRRPPVSPDELIVVTTLEGERYLEQSLLETGVWETFTRKYNLEHLRNLRQSLIVLPHIDAITPLHNSKIANLFFEQARKITDDPTRHLHAFLAGGRKSMSFYLGMCLSLLGRPGDHLYHIYVSPSSYENDPNFNYPDGKNPPATVTLADLPFPHLRHMLYPPISSLEKAMEQAQRSLEKAVVPPPLSLSLAGRCIEIGAQTVALPPALLMLYALLMLRKLRACPHPDRKYCEGCTDCYATIHDLERGAHEHHPAFYARIYPGRVFLLDDLKGRLQRMTHSTLRQHMSRLKRVLAEQVSDKLLPFYTVHTIRAYAATRYCVLLDRDHLSIEEDI